jgi:hypothetical protein
MPPQQNTIMIYGPKLDGTYVVEFRTTAGESLAISVPGSEAAVLKYFQARMPYGLVAPDAEERLSISRFLQTRQRRQAPPSPAHASIP